MNRLVTLKSFAAWNAIRAVWMASLTFLDLRALLLSGYSGPYAGVGIDGRLMFTVAAMPTKLVGILAGFCFGRAADITIGLVAAIAYCLVAIGVWHHRETVRVFAVAMTAWESLLLTAHIYYAIASPVIPGPELRPLTVISGGVFLAVYASVAAYLLRAPIRALFNGGRSSAAPA